MEFISNVLDFIWDCIWGIITFLWSCLMSIVDQIGIIKTIIVITIGLVLIGTIINLVDKRKEKIRDNEREKRRLLEEEKKKTCPKCNQVKGVFDRRVFTKIYNTTKYDRKLKRDVRWIGAQVEVIYNCESCGNEYIVSKYDKDFGEDEMKETCPNCFDMNGIFDGKDVVDRYETTKEVEEVSSSGKTKTRHVKCTKVVEKEFYKCAKCGNRYDVKEEIRELN